MKVLLDEQLHPACAEAINAFTASHGLEASWIGSFAAGTKDPDIPELCANLGFEVLITANVKDFGARLSLYEELVSHGISVVVLRPGKAALTPEEQAALMLRHARRVAALVRDAGAPIIVKMTPSDVSPRHLEELRDEVLGRTRKLP